MKASKGGCVFIVWLLTTCLFSLSTPALFAQGGVDFRNTSTTKLTTNSTFGPPPGQSPNQTGNTQLGFTIGLYIAPQGTTDPNAFTLIGPTTTSQGGIVAGRFDGGSVFIISGNNGQTISFQVRAWSTFAGPTYEAARSYSGGPVPYTGTSTIGYVTPSTSGSPPAPPLFGTGPGQVGGFVLTPGFIPPPEVSITSPTNGSLFSAPANVPVDIHYYQSEGGVVSLLELFTNDVRAAQYPWPPTYFSGIGSTNVTLSNLTAGYYTLRARASSASATTSAPVTVRVADLPVLTFARGSNGPIQFQFNSATGINYVIERGGLTNFSPVITNAGSAGPIFYSETNGGATQRTYRVRLQ